MWTRPDRSEDGDIAGSSISQRQAHHQTAEDAGEKLQADGAFLGDQFARQQDVEGEAKGRRNRV